MLTFMQLSHLCMHSLPQLQAIMITARIPAIPAGSLQTQIREDKGVLHANTPNT